MDMKRVDAGHGLVVSIPKDYALARKGDDACRVYLPSRERSRSPVDIIITTAGAPAAPKNAETKHLEKRDVHYVIAEEEGGSGGTALRLRAWATTAGHNVMLESVVQPESGGDSEFRAEWAILVALP